MALPKNPPVTNRAGADKNKAATAIHMQGQFKAGAAPQDASTLQKLGAAFTGEQRAQDVAATGAEASKDVAVIEQEQKVGQLEQGSQNIKDQEQLTQSIEENKNKLVEMSIDINEDEFATSQDLEKLERDQEFTNETQLLDLALLSFEDKADFEKMLIQSNQKIQEQAAEDQWELDVYEEAEKDGVISRAIAADAKLAAEFAVAKAEAQRKARESRRKAANSNRTTAAVGFAAGATMTAFGGGVVGGPLMAQSAQTYAQAESQPEEDQNLA